MRRRAAGVLAALLLGTASVVIGTASVAAGGQAASAAVATRTQSVGRFVDGAVGGRALEQLADVADARATNPGTVSDQNPLDVTAIQAIHLPLTGSLQLSSVAGIQFGAANQVAVARSDGYSYGAAGAVANSGAASIGGHNTAFPATAAIDLSPAGLATTTAVSVPGIGSAEALGSVQLRIGAVSALAQTSDVAGAASSTHYSIVGLDVHAASPALAKILGSLTRPLQSTITTLRTLAQSAGAPIPAGCPLTTAAIPNLSVASGAVTINAQTGELTISLSGLLDAILGGSDNINRLAPNTDLIDVVLGYFSSATGLVRQVVDAIGPQVIDALQAGVDACAPKAIASLVDPAFDDPAIVSARTSIVKAIDGLLSTGTNPLAPIGTALRQLVDIGVNVQPNGQAGTFTSRLASTPDQATAVVAEQTIVRAVEIDVLGDPLAAFALANAASGPSEFAGLLPPISTTRAGTEIPTAVPAGHTVRPGAPTVALVLLGVGLSLAGAVAIRTRGRRMF